MCMIREHIEHMVKNVIKSFDHGVEAAFTERRAEFRESFGSLNAWSSPDNSKVQNNQHYPENTSSEKLR